MIRFFGYGFRFQSQRFLRLTTPLLAYYRLAIDGELAPGHVLRISRSPRIAQFFDSDPLAASQAGASLRSPLKKSRVMLKSIIEPVVHRPETDQDPCGLSMPPHL